MKARTSIVITSLISCVFCTAITSHALLYEFNRDLSNTFKDDPKTWLTAEFQDTTRLISGNTTSGVLLKLRALELGKLPGSVFVSNWFFNNTLESGISSLKYVSDTTGTALPTISTNKKDLNAGTGAKFDLNFQFPTENKDRFENSDSADIFMYGVTGLTADSFNALSDKKQYFAEAHIQGISTGAGSIWVVPGSGSGHPGSTPSSVPEPGGLVLFGVGLLGLAIYAKRHMNHQ